MFSYVGKGFASGRMFDNFIGSLRSSASKVPTPAPKDLGELPMSELPMFANAGIGGLASTMLAGAGVGAVTGGLASGGETGGILKGAAAGAFGGAVARRMYQPTLMAANRGANAMAGLPSKMASTTADFGKGGEFAMKLGQRGQQFSKIMDDSVNMFHNTGVRRAAYMSGAGLAGAAAGYRNNKRGQGQGYQSKNLSSGRLNSGRGNMLHR
jgi:hypothetical protein